MKSQNHRMNQAGGRRTQGAARRMRPLVMALAVAACVPSLWGAGENIQVNNVAAGTAAITRQGSVTTIQTQSHKTIINYHKLSVGAGETLRFDQPGATSRVLNRIQGTEPTRIDGALLSNGRVYLVNPAGVMFGNGAVVNAAGIFAAAGNISDANFLAGKNAFTGNTGVVRNDGLIQAAEVHLVGAGVVNLGQIVTTGDGGVVTLTAGKDVYIGETVSPTGQTSVLVKVSPDAAAPAQVSDHSGSLARGAGDVIGAGIYNAGTIKGRAITLNSGANTNVNRGTIDARSATGQGGRVEMLGDKVGVFAGTVDASGATGGGTVLVGGDLQGGNEVPVSDMAVVADGAKVRADATVEGKGGTIIVFASNEARVGADTLSVVGAGNGSGGFVETSGLQNMTIGGAPALGSGGTWLIDPFNLTISSNPTANVGGTFIATASGANVNVSDLVTALADGTGAHVTITTGTSGAETGNITLANTLDFDAGGTNDGTLTLTAAGSILLQESITTGNNDSLVVNLLAGGNVTIDKQVETGGAAFSSNGVDFTLNSGTLTVTDSTAVIAHTGAVALNGPVAMGTGALSITAGGNVSQTSTITAGTVGVNSGGTIDLSQSNAVGTVTLASQQASAAVTFSSTTNLTLQQFLSGTVTLAATNNGVLTVTSGGTLAVDSVNGAISTGSGDMELVADDVNIAGAATALSTTGAVAIRPLTNSRPIGLGAAGGAGTLTLTQAELANIASTASVVIGSDAQSGDITVRTLNLAGTAGGFTSLTLNSASGNIVLDDNGAGPALALNGNLALNGTAITAATAANSHAELAVVTDGQTITMAAAGSIGTGTNPIEIGKLVGAVQSGYDGALTISTPGDIAVFLGGIGNLNFGAVSAGTSGTLTASAATGILGGGTLTAGTVVLSAGTGGIGAASVLTLAGAVTAGSLTTAGAGAAGNIHITSLGASSPTLVFATADSSQTILYDKTGDLTIDNDITVGSSGGLLVLQGGASGTGSLTFSGTPTILSDRVSLRAGALDGVATTALVNIPAASVTLANSANTGDPLVVELRQDATLADAPDLVSLGALTAVPQTLLLASVGGSLTLATASRVAGSSLTLQGATGVFVNDSLTGANAVASLAIVGSTFLDGDVTTTGDMNITGTLELRKDVALAGVNLTVSGAVSSEASQFWTLDTNFSGATAFQGGISGGATTQLGALDTAGGTIEFGSGPAIALQTTENLGVNALADGHISIGQALSLNGNLTVTVTTTTAVGSLNAGDADVTFAGTINSGAGSVLAVNTPGVTWFQASIGGSGALGGVSTDHQGGALEATLLGNGGAFAITVASPITFNDDVVLMANATLTAPGASGHVTFNRAVNSQAASVWALTVNAGGMTSFAGDVGAAPNGELGALITDAPGTLVLGGGGPFAIVTLENDPVNAAASGVQSLGEPITLLSDATLTAGATVFNAGDTDITLGQLSGGDAFGIAVNTPGVTWFQGGVNATAGQGLTTIATDAGGSTQLGTAGAISVVTSGAQTYNDAVSLLGKTAFRGAALNFNGAPVSIAAGAFDLALASNAMSFAGGVDSVQGTGNLSLMPEADAHAIVIGTAGAAVNTLFLSRPDLLTFQDGFASITIGSPTGTHVITISSDHPGPTFEPVEFRDPVTIQSPGGTITLNSPDPAVTPGLYGDGNASIALIGGAIVLNGAIVTNGNGILLDGAIALGSPVRIDIKSHGTDSTNTFVSGPAGGPITVMGTVDDDVSPTLLVVDAGFGGVRDDVDWQASTGVTTPLNGFGAAADEFRLHADIRTTDTAAPSVGDGVLLILSNSLVLEGNGSPTTITLDTDASGGLANAGVLSLTGIPINHEPASGAVDLVIDTSATGAMLGAPISLGTVGAVNPLNNLTLIAGDEDVTVGAVTLNGALASSGDVFQNSGAVTASGITINHTGAVAINDDLDSPANAVSITGNSIVVASGAPVSGSVVTLTDTTGTTLDDVVSASTSFSASGPTMFTISPTGGITTSNDPVTISYPTGLVTVNGPINAGTGTVAITGLGISSGGGGTIGGGSVTLAGGASAVNLSTAVTATGPLGISGVGITTGATATLGGTAITLAGGTGNVTLGAAVNGTGVFTSSGVDFSNAAAVTASGITINHTGAVAINDDLVSPGSAVSITGNSIVVASGAPVSGSVVTLTDTNGTTLNDVVSVSTSFSASGPTTFTISPTGGITTSNDPVTISYPTGLVTVNGPISAGTGTVAITGLGVSSGAGGTIGGGSVTLAGGASAVNLSAAVTATGPLGISGVGITTGATATLGGTAITLAGGTGNVTLGAAVNGTGLFTASGVGFSNAAAVTASGITINHTGAVAINDDLVSPGSAVSITGNSIVVASGAPVSGSVVTLTDTTGTTLNDGVSASTSFSASGPTTFTISPTGGITTSNDPVTISYPTGLVTVNGPISAGTGTVAITGLGISSGGGGTIGGGSVTLAGGSSAVNLSAAVTATGPLGISGVGITTGAAATLGGTAITLAGGTGNVTLGAAVNGTGLFTASGGGFSNTATVSAVGATLTLSGPVSIGGALSGGAGATNITGTTFINTAPVSGASIALNFSGLATLQGNLVAGAGTGPVVINAAGVNQNAGAVTGSTLRVSGTGAFAFQTANAIGSTVAANVTGNFVLVNQTSLTIGTVGATSGITTNGGAANVAVNSGTLLVSRPINSGSGTITLANPLGIVTVSNPLNGGAVQITGNTVGVAHNITTSVGDIVLITPSVASVGATLTSAGNVSIGPAAFTIAGPVALTGNTSITASGSIGIFMGAVTGASNLTLTSNHLASTIAVGGLGTSIASRIGNVTFQSANLVALGGDIYAQNVVLNDANLLGTRPDVPTTATITSDGSRLIDANGTFAMELNQKFSVHDSVFGIGDLSIVTNQQTITVGDLSALGKISLDTNDFNTPIVFLQRAPQRELLPTGLLDTDLDKGADVVAGFNGPGAIFMRGTVAVVGGTPTNRIQFAAAAASADIATNPGTLGYLAGSNLLVVPVNTTSPIVQGDFLFGTTVLDLVAQGISGTSPTATQGTVIPRDVQTLSPERGQAISGALRDALRELGIYARDLRTDEILEYLIGRALYDDVPYKLDPGPTDTTVAANRLPFSPVLPTVDAYRRLFFTQELDEEGKPVLEDDRPKMIPQDAVIRRALGLTWQAYSEMKGTEATPEGFRTYLEEHEGDADGNARSALSYLNQLRDLLTQIRNLGLTDTEFDVSRKVLFSKVCPPNIREEDFADVVYGPSSRAAGVVVTR